MTVQTLTRSRARPKEFHFPLTVEWIGDRRVSVRVAGKRPIEVTPPPVFRGTDPASWTPEDLFVAAAASCLAVTFTGQAERAGLRYSSLTVEADGVAGARSDGRFGFTRVVLRMAIAADDVGRARQLALEAERTCLVAASFDVPVDVEIDVRPEWTP